LNFSINIRNNSKRIIKEILFNILIFLSVKTFSYSFFGTEGKIFLNSFAQLLLCMLVSLTNILRNNKIASISLLFSFKNSIDFTRIVNNITVIKQ